MAISLDAIYQPLNHFFLQKFGQPEGAPISFRFAQIPVGFYDSDFVPLSNPGFGPSPALATEQLSNMVDGVTRLDPSGRGVWLDTPRISNLYHDEILGPSLPFLPADADADAKQVVIDSFSQIKSDAISHWENCKAQSLLVNGSQFRPCSAKPQAWWNKADPGVWTPQEFQIQGAATTTPTTPDQPPNQLLRLKVSDSVLQPILASHVNLAGPPPSPRFALAPNVSMVSRSVMLSQPTLLVARPMFTATLARTATVAQAQPATTMSVREPIMMVAASPATSVAMHTELLTRSAVIPVRERMELQTMLTQVAPTQTVAVTDVTISFDYCLVTVDRPWMHTAFLDNKSWFIPGQPSGKLSANDGHGVPALPAGFVALKNLQIKGPWTPADITNLEQSIQFGPFLIDSTVVAGAIGHAGIQIVGWILQDMPDLAPADGTTPA